MVRTTMSWTEGATSEDFTPSLEIDGEKVAYVEIAEEPRKLDFGKKKVTRKGKKVEIDDIRYCVQIIYAGGTAEAKTKDQDSGKYDYFPPENGEEYTLWLGATLTRSMLKAIGWEKGDPDPILVGTKWKVYRSKEKHGGHRLYASEKLDSFPTTFSGVDFGKDDDVTVVIKKPAIDEETDTLKTDARKYAPVLKPLGEIDISSWETYCKRQGYEGEAFENLLNTMVLEGLVEVDKERNLIIYKGN